MCALRAQITVELEPDMQHINFASHTFLRKVWLVHVAIAPQACQVEFELLEGMQQQNTSWTKHQVASLYCVQTGCAT